MFENPFITLTLMVSTFLAGAVPEASGLAYFAKFFWNRFYKSTVLNSGLKPAEEFIRGTSPGFALGFLFKAGEAEAPAYLIVGAILFLFLLIGFFRQKKGMVKDA